MAVATGQRLLPMDSVAAGREADDESMVVEVDSTEGADADVTAANETTVSTPVNDPPMRVMHRSICHDYVSLTAIFLSMSSCCCHPLFS